MTLVNQSKNRDGSWFTCTRPRDFESPKARELVEKGEYTDKLDGSTRRWVVAAYQPNPLAAFAYSAS